MVSKRVKRKQIKRAQSKSACGRVYKNVFEIPSASKVEKNLKRQIFSTFDRDFSRLHVKIQII